MDSGAICSVPEPGIGTIVSNYQDEVLQKIEASWVATPKQYRCSAGHLSRSPWTVDISDGETQVGRFDLCIYCLAEFFGTLPKTSLVDKKEISPASSIGIGL